MGRVGSKERYVLVRYDAILGTGTKCTHSPKWRVWKARFHEY